MSIPHTPTQQVAPASGLHPSNAEGSGATVFDAAMREVNRLVYDVPLGTRGAALDIREALNHLRDVASADGWSLLETAPRDGSWFEATDGLCVRRVHFADRHDRLPVNGEGMWDRFPWLWRPAPPTPPSASADGTSAARQHGMPSHE
jgi:hypothetical protein